MYVSIHIKGNKNNMMMKAQKFVNLEIHQSYEVGR